VGLEENAVTMHLLLISALALGTVSQNPQLRLRQVFEQYRVDPGPGAMKDLDSSVGTFMVDNTDDFFFVAYRPKEDVIDLGLVDKKLKTWKHASTPQDALIGSFEEITHTPTRFYIHTHLNPSAGSMIVLDRSLRVLTILFGFRPTILPDETVIYYRSQVHFAPTHSAELWIYDRNGRDRRLYPNPPYQQVRLDYIQTVKRIYDEKGEQWFRENNHHGDPASFDSEIDNVVVNDATESVAFIATFGGDGQVPTPAQDVLVVCRNIESLSGTCTEKALGDINSVHPSESNKQIVWDAIH
jgi:hypothetical protein